MIIVDDATEKQGNIKFDEVIKMRIDGNAAALIIRTLTNLYSNPYEAALREYTSNAYDSHFMAKQSRPVEVSLPTRLSPNLVIEDFGVGLDRDGLRDYGQYGKTSKNGSNDEIGGFGLGSKSGLAISTQFTVTAVKNGRINTVVIGYNEQGAPTMSMMDERDTLKPNGVKITIPTNEVSKFQTAIDNQLFIGWKPGSILINGVAPERSIYDTTQYTAIDNHGWLSTTAVRNDYYNRSSGRAVIGPVSYKIAWSSISGVPRALREGYFRDVVVNLPIGSVDLTPSREDMIYSARTRTALDAAIEAMIEHGKIKYRDDIAAASSIRDALLRKVTASDHGFGDASYLYNGKTLIPAAYTGSDSGVLSVAGLSKRYRSVGHTYYASIWKADLRIHSDIMDKSRDALRDRKLVLVTEAGGLVQQNDLTRVNGRTPRSVPDAGLHIVASKSLAPYSQMLLEKGEIVAINERSYLFTSLRVDQLDPVFVGAFVTVMTADQITTPTEAYIAAKRKEQRAARAALGKATVGDTKARLVSYRSGGRSTYSELAISDLDPTLTYIVLKNEILGTDLDTTKVISSEQRLVYSMRRAITTMNGFEDERGLAAVAARLDDEGYRFLLANKSWKTDLYPQVLPNIVTITEAVEIIIGTVVSSMTTAQIQAAIDAGAGRSYDWTTSLFQEHIDLIESDVTREWVTAINSDISKKYKFVQHAVLLADRLLIDASKHTLNVTVADSPGERFPLLNSIYSFKGAAKAHAVEYINMIDARHAVETAAAAESDSNPVPVLV